MAPGASAGQSSALAARIEEKKAELESLRELRDLSGDVASQMEALENKLSTLTDGTQGTILYNTFYVPSDATLTIVFLQPSQLLSATGIMCCELSTWHLVSSLAGY